MGAVNQKERFHFLDGLRGIASLMIVIHHSLTANIVALINRSGFPFLGELFSQFTQSGVDLFFVLSGVVLLRPYLRGQREFSAGDYFYRRLKRIYPPYFFALLFGAFVVWFINTYPTWYNVKGLRVQFSWPETFRELFIFSLGGIYYNLAWWSLQIEILFYMVVPLVIYTFPKPGRLTIQRMVLTTLTVWLVAFGIQHLSTNFCDEFYSFTYKVNKYSKFIEYPVCFLMGVYLAAKDFSGRQGRLLALAGIGLVVAGLAASAHSYVYISVMHSGFGLFYAGLITLAFQEGGFKQLLGKPVMVWLGERSYSLFLVHFSVFYLTDSIISHFTADRTLAYGLATRLVGIPLAFFCAMLLFHFVERRQARGLLTDKAFWPWQVRGLKD